MGSTFSAEISRWDKPYPNGANGEKAPGLEAAGVSKLYVDVQVNNGGQAKFEQGFRTWDAGLYDWYDIYIETPTGIVSILSKFGKPGSDYGTFWLGPYVPMTIDLFPYIGKKVRFVFSVSNDGWGDQTQGLVRGFKVGMGCSVSPLKPITDEDAVRFEANGGVAEASDLDSRLSPAMGCLVDKLAAAAQTPTVNSTYRPLEYQRHLTEVWDKHHQLQQMTDPQCDDLKKEVEEEFEKYRMIRRPAVDSKHTYKPALAVDIGWGSRNQRGIRTYPEELENGENVTDLADSCGLMRPEPGPDPVHFQLK